MDKPRSMSVKDFLMRKMSLSMNIPLKTIEAVVEHQFKEANDAIKTSNTLELSGFGKFSYNTKKAQKKLDKNYSKEKGAIERMALVTSEQDKKSWEMKLAGVYKTISQIKPKLEHEQTIRIPISDTKGTTEVSADSESCNDRGTDEV